MNDVRMRLAALEQRAAARPCPACQGARGVCVTLPDDLVPTTTPRCQQCGQPLTHVIVEYEPGPLEAR